MKTLVVCMPGIFGAVTGGLIVWVSGYWVVDWQWWVVFLPIVVSAVVWVDIAETEQKRKRG